jgi:hypothetical protein
MKHGRAQNPFLLLAVFFLLPAVAWAQVNAERFRPAGEMDGLHAQVDGSFGLKAGNVNWAQVGIGTRVEYLMGLHTPLIYAKLSMARRDDAQILNDGFVHARWTAMWLSALGTDVFAQLQYNEFLLLRTRALVGAGPRVIFLDQPWARGAITSGYMLEHESLNLPEDATHPAMMLNHRWTNTLTLGLKLAPQVTLGNTIYIQPRFDDFTDLRILDEADLAIAIGANLSIVSALSFRHDTRPPDGLASTDVAVSQALRFSF